MNLIAYLLILAAAFVVSLWVSRPFNQPQPASVKPGKQAYIDDVEALESEHQRLLDALQELDFDHAQGKLDEVDYAEQRSGLLQSGAGVLKQIDDHNHIRENK
jgi:hypothetical protein